jgi:hypothetical protein
MLDYHAGKEYSKGDSRYATRDAFVVTMEVFTDKLQSSSLHTDKLAALT